MTENNFDDYILKVLRVLIFVVLIVGFVFLLVMGIYNLFVSEDICKKECLNDGAITYQRIAGGGLDIDRDICICYFKDKIKTFKLEEYHE